MKKTQNDIFDLQTINRRNFLMTTSKGATGIVLLSSPLSLFAQQKEYTVGDVMDAFINEVPNAPFKTTVDTLKAGNRDIKVTGIVTTTFATVPVIKKAIELKANFIIAHEPTFYNHQDDTEWLKNDTVYKYKANLLQQHDIAVWRNHDYIHTHQPDGVKQMVVKKLGWEKSFDTSTNIALLPAITLQQLINHAKQKLGIQTLRYNGDLQQPCKKVLLMPGAAGGKRQIEALIKEQPDVLICGEIQEWETAEYVRDAIAKGQQLSLIVLGHIASEQPGGEYMATWLKEKFPTIRTTFVPTTPSLKFL
ncbi:MAG: Nif3-like dinuclear metal center hexameric protein [Chitinophagaceae bacterium]|nr:Nif3-like dinuclear metal center hexameric protein [Chitinophagaceae bacterium]